MKASTFAICILATLLTSAETPAATNFLVPDQSSRVDDYVVTVERKFTNDFEAGLIKQAESAYGDVADPDHPEKSPDRRTKRWWCDEFDGVRIVCAVTEDSVRYYLDLVTSFREGDFSQVKGFEFKRASLAYHASVKYHPTFQIQKHQFVDVYVVTLNLDWAATCGLLCGHYPEKKRVVVFNAKGELLVVVGDGWESFVVSEHAPKIRPNPALQAAALKPGRA